MGRGSILTFSERPDVAAELLAVGRRLADAANARLVSALPGTEPDKRAAEQIAHGADEVLLLSAPSLTDTDCLLAGLERALETATPSVVLVGATRNGAEVAGRLAQRLRLAAASECTELELDANGALVVERLVYGGRFVARQVLEAEPKIATVPVKRFEPLPRDGRRSGEVHELSVEVPPSRIELIELKERTRSEVDIGEAQIIIAAGRGVRSKDDIAILEPLARALGAEIAASRPLVELQWFPSDRQVGLSGRTVKPRLYLACGVSGQIEHIAGMRSAETVVAINTDENAPIHREADYIVVGDLYEIVPALVRAIEEATG